MNKIIERFSLRYLINSILHDLYGNLSHLSLNFYHLKKIIEKDITPDQEKLFRDIFIQYDNLIVHFRKYVRAKPLQNFDISAGVFYFELKNKIERLSSTLECIESGIHNKHNPRVPYVMEQIKSCQNQMLTLINSLGTSLNIDSSSENHITSNAINLVLTNFNLILSKQKINLIIKHESIDFIIKRNFLSLGQSLNIILGNIISIFKREINKNGTVEIKYFLENENLIIIIEDNGPGISPEVLLSVLESGFLTEDDNLGTGLSLAKAIIESELDGTIEINSKNGVGMLIKITIPKYDEN